MKKKHHAFTEHYLVPAVLILLNVCVAHVIYAFAAGASYTLPGKAALALALVIFVISLTFKKQALLYGSIVFYTLVVIWA